MAPALALLPVLLALPAAGNAGAEWTAFHFSTGVSFNHTLAVGDLNGDGRLDVATPNSQTSAVTVFLGNGNGTLQAFQSWPTFSEPQDVVMADLTGDAVPDLATPDYSGGGVTLLRGLGNGTFDPRVGFPIGPGLVSLTAVDLDGDGRLDLAVSKESGNKVAVLPALPGGGFGTAIEVATGTLPHQIVTSDFNHDLKPDLAVASNGAGAVSVHLGDSTHTPGSATPFASGALPVGLSVADLNADDHPDLLVTNVNAATLSVLLGNGDGTFDAPVGYPTASRPRGMDVGDLDGDDVPDVAVATGYPDGDSVLTVYRGIGDGTLQLFDTVQLPYRAADCVIADMNGDGHLDIVATGPQAGVVSVLLNPMGIVGVPTPDPGSRGLELRLHPNPGGGATSIAFVAPRGEAVTLTLFDLAGRRIADLGDFVGTSTPQQVHWSGRRADGRPAAPGVYLVRLRSAAGHLHRRLVLLTR